MRLHRSHPFLKILLIIAALSASAIARPQGPDMSLARHDFFYAGEAKEERMFIVRKGHVEWSYTHAAKGEISDATLLKYGHILFAHQSGVTELNIRRQRVAWNFDAPPTTEIHTVQPYGKRHVAFIENGNPAKLVVMNKATGAVDHEFTLQVAHLDKIHP